MKILRTVEDVRAWQKSLANKNVGFVPTMGALHNGHGSLVKIAKDRGDLVLVSIFVNPTQFNDPSDLAKYPRDERADLERLMSWGADAVFIPSSEEIYNDGFIYTVDETRESQILCGAYRPGHFKGVLTVVMKLFNIVQPSRAYFGEKDYQQLKLIEGMTHAFHLPVELVPGPTVREADGLAMSSRNALLAPEERERAPALFKILRTAQSTEDAKRELAGLGFEVEYVEEKWGRRLAAAYLGSVRLIDNVAL